MAPAVLTRHAVSGDTRTLRIRIGEPDDLQALADIERETAAMFPPAVLPPALAHPLPESELAIAMRAGLLWVAEIECSGPAGFMLAEPHGSSLHIREIDVRPRFGRRGIGTSLLEQADRVAAWLRLRFLTLTTFRSVAWNAPFYAKRGFVRADDLYRFPHLQHALLYEAHTGLRDRIAMVRSVAFARHSSTATGRPFPAPETLRA